jgi:hypothetical protein
MFPRAHNPGFYDRVLAAFAQAGVTPRIADEVWPRANAIGLVRAGLGATFMAPSEAKQLPDEVVFRSLDGSAPESRLVLGWRKDTSPDPALGAFLVVAGASRPDGGKMLSSSNIQAPVKLKTTDFNLPRSFSNPWSFPGVGAWMLELRL